MKARILAASGAALCALLCNHSAMAQTAAAPKNQIEDIVVTARKKAEAVSRTPIAVTAVSAVNLKRQGVVTLDNLGTIAPNVVIDHGSYGSGINIAMRGVQDNDEGPVQTAGVAVNIDGVQQLDTGVLGVPFLDLDRIEVLRGPQGTLYGAASPGGVVNVISHRPDFNFEGSAGVEIGNFNTKRGTFMVNAPITDQLAVRLAVAANDRDGYLNQIAGDDHGYVNGNYYQVVGANGGGHLAEDAEHDVEARGSALYRYSDDTSALFAFTGVHSYNSPYSSVPYLNLYDDSGAMQRSGPANPIDPNTDDTYLTGNTDLQTTWGPVAAEFLGGLEKIRLNDTIVDNGGVIPPGGPGWIWFPVRQQETAADAELRLHNAAPTKLEWTLGFSFTSLRDKSETAQMGAPCTNVSIDYSAGGTCDNNLSYDGPIDPNEANSFVNNSTWETIYRHDIGVYGTAQYHITPTIEITGGLRESEDSIGQRSQTFAWNGSFNTDPCNYNNLFSSPVCSGQSASTSTEASRVVEQENYSHPKLTWRAGADYKPSASQMFFVNIATGYKPGGFNNPSAYASVPSAYQPENLTEYEAGYKGRPFSWLYLDSDVFYYDYKGIQVENSYQVSVIPAQFVSLTTNADATVYGTENSATFTITPADTFTLGVNLLHAVYDNLIAGGNSGNPLENWNNHALDDAPTFTTTANYRHVFDLDRHGNLAVNVSTAFTAQYWFSVITNDQTYRQPSFTRSNADITYTTLSGKYSIQAFVSNIEDKVQITHFNGNPFQIGNGNVGISQPRFFGVRLNTKF